jgi:hypothetical protein
MPLGSVNPLNEIGISQSVPQARQQLSTGDGIHRAVTEIRPLKPPAAETASSELNRTSPHEPRKQE